MAEHGVGSGGAFVPPPPGSPPPPPPPGGGTAGTGRGKVFAFLAALLVVVLAAVAFIVLTRDDKKTKTGSPSSTDSSSVATDTGSSTDSGSTDSGTASTADSGGVDTNPRSMGNAFGDGGVPTRVIANGDKGFLATGFVSRDGKTTDRGGLWSGPADGSSLNRAGKGSAIEAPGLLVKDVAVRGDRGVAVGVNQSGGGFGEAALLSSGKDLNTWRLEFNDLDAGAAVSMESVAVDRQGWVAVGTQSTDGSGADASFKPVVLVSKDGTDWTSSSPVVPAGFASAYMSSVTVAGSGTPFPGFVAAGVGFTPDAAIGGLRKVGLVWQSSDQGKTWKVVSDQGFDFEKRDREPSQIAADDTTIFVVGRGDTADRDAGPAGTTVPQSAEYWHIAAGQPKWGVNVDDLAPGRSSRAIAVTANPAGGFVTASQLFDTGSTGNFQVELNTTRDGLDYTTITDFAANLVDGVATNGKVVVFVGRNTRDQGDAWVTKL